MSKRIVVESLAEKFGRMVSYCRSVDCFLTKISALVDDVEDLARYLGVSPVHLLDQVLSHSLEALRPLNGYKDVVESMLSTPRYKHLSKYSQIILSYIGEGKPTVKLETIRPSTSALEREGEEEYYVYVKLMGKPKQSMKVKAAIILAVITALALLILLGIIK